jgi:hypothetical protein
MKTREIICRYFESLVFVEVISLDDYAEIMYAIDGVELSDDASKTIPSTSHS